MSGFHIILQELEVLSDEYGLGNEHLHDALKKIFPNSSTNEKTNDLDKLTDAYHNYKRDYVKHLFFTPDEGENLSKNVRLINILKRLFSATTLLDHAPLEAVYIYFDTATYDEIERDEKVTHYGGIFFFLFDLKMIQR